MDLWDQISQKCTVRDSTKLVLERKLLSDKNKIVHIHENWSPGSQNFFLHYFFSEVHQISRDFRSELSNVRSRETFAPREALQVFQ